MKRFSVPNLVVTLCAVALGLAGAATTAIADETGFASAHTLRKERGRLCMSDHYHSGGGGGPNRKAAEIAAIKSWQNFTALEYGSNWARFSRAAGKSMSCSPNSSGVECSVSARACR
jgi:hypothetical protein